MTRKKYRAAFESVLVDITSFTYHYPPKIQNTKNQTLHRNKTKKPTQS